MLELEVELEMEEVSSVRSLRERRERAEGVVEGVSGLELDGFGGKGFIFARPINQEALKIDGG